MNKIITQQGQGYKKGQSTVDAETNNFYNNNMELNMNKSYSHTINTNGNVGNTTTSVGTKTTAKADSVNSNNKHKEMDMSNNNVTKGEQLEEKALMNKRLEAHQSDYKLVLDILKSKAIKDNVYHQNANNFPVTMQLEYMAARAIYFKNIPLEIKSGIYENSKEEDLLACIQALLQYLFKDADREYYVIDLAHNGIAEIVKDIESALQ